MAGPGTPGGPGGPVPAAADDGSSAVSGTLTATPGRFLLSAGTNHFVSDTRDAPGEAVTAGELFVSALVSCSLTNIGRYGTELGADLTGTRVSARSERDPDDSTRYRSVVLTFSFPHVPDDVSHEIVNRFTDTCPIYNTVRRGGNIDVVVLKRG